MYNKLAVVLFSILLATITACTDGSSEVPSFDSSQDWSTDIDWLRDSFPQLHYNLFLYQPQDSFYVRLDRLEEDLDQLSDWEVVMELTRVVASMQCSHTGIGFFEYGSFGAYPLSVWWLDQGLFVTAIDRQHQQLLGSQLLLYGDRPALEAAMAMAGMFPARNPVVQRTWATNFLMMKEPMGALGYGDSELPVQFTFLTAQAETVAVDMHSVGNGCADMVTFTDTAPENLPIYLQSNDFYWFRYLPENDLLYIAYNTCAEMPGYPISDFVDDLESTINQVDADALIVDLRRNTGGNSLIAAPLIQWLSEQSEEMNRGIFLVIGRWTYSSGILNSLEILDATNALLIGEATSGAPNHLGEVRTGFLPWSGLSVSYPTNYFVTVDGEGSTLEPQVHVPLTPDALFHGRDDVLETILELIE